MKNVQKIDLGLTGYDELFANDEERKVNKLGELIFNMLILVGAVKMADRLVKEMMGI